MKRLPHVSLGIPVKQVVKFEDETHDNFYLLKLKSVDYVSDKDGVSYTTHYHLFTHRELITAVNRYYNEYNGKGLDVVIGYSFPVTFACKRNNALVTVHMCKFRGDQVQGMRHVAHMALFSAREMRRSKERAERYYDFAHESKWSRLMKGLKWMIGV